MKTRQRSMQDFKEFLRIVYLKKKGTGVFLSDDSYCSYLRQFIKIRRISEHKLHTLSKSGMMREIFKFEDVEIGCENFAYYKSGADAYYDYIRYTMGYYQSSAA